MRYVGVIQEKNISTVMENKPRIVSHLVAVSHNNVIGVAMPSRFSSIHSIEDAQKLCDNLRIDLLKLNN